MNRYLQGKCLKVGGDAGKKVLGTAWEPVLVFENIFRTLVPRSIFRNIELPYRRLYERA